MAGGVAIGCMRLSTASAAKPALAEEEALEVLLAALDAGVRTLDTADVYCRGEADIGANERLVARALAARPKLSDVRVATKGGLTRPRGAWVPDGRAGHLRAACEASARALGRAQIELYQLHTVDPKVPLATSVRALAKLQREGVILHAGLCNVTVSQIQEAQQIMPIAAVQVSLSLWDVTAVRGGVVGYCREHGIELLAHSPLGGARRSDAVHRHRVLGGATPQQTALSWLRTFGVTPLPGPTTVASAEACGVDAALEGDAPCALDAHVPAVHQLRVPQAHRRPPADAVGEVVIVMGIPGGGKSVWTQGLLERGYTRLNRDERGGTMAKLHRALSRALADGARRIVLDNTYPTRALRNEVVQLAWEAGVPVRIVWIDAALEDARIGVVERMLRTHGRLPDPEEIRTLAKQDPAALPVSAQTRFARTLEAPCAAEGASVEVVQPLREVAAGAERGEWVVADVDALASHGVSGAELRAACPKGASLVGVSWRPRGQSASPWPGIVELDLDVESCEHPGGPQTCWCRPPFPGLVLAAAASLGRAYQDCVFVGAGARSRRFAEACRAARFVDLGR